MAVEEQIFDAYVDEFMHPARGLKQSLDHQPVFALGLVSSLNEPLDFAVGQAVDRSFPFARLYSDGLRLGS